jgi:hypothetical protein
MELEKIPSCPGIRTHDHPNAKWRVTRLATMPYNIELAGTCTAEKMVRVGKWWRGSERTAFRWYRSRVDLLFENTNRN